MNVIASCLLSNCFVKKTRTLLTLHVLQPSNYTQNVSLHFLKFLALAVAEITLKMEIL